MKLLNSKIKLKRIDLSKGVKSDHPEIKTGEEHRYLARIRGSLGDNLIVGSFSREWYGLNFSWFWGASSLQFNTPGYNNSDWLELWEITNPKIIKPKPKPISKKMFVCPWCGERKSISYQCSKGYCVSCSSYDT